MNRDTIHENPRTAKASRIVRENGIIYALGIIAAYGLKYHYSTADAEALSWMLTPLAGLSGFVSGIHFERELHAGFVNLFYGVRIAPACAGINFMIICFSTLLFPFAHRLQGLAAKFRWFCISIAAAYLATLLANTIRVLISIKLYGASVPDGGISPETLHRLAGTVIFLSSLIAIYLIAERITTSSLLSKTFPTNGRGGRLAGGTLLVPITCYLAVTVVIPLLNGSCGQSDKPAAAHLMLVAGSGITFLLAAMVIGSLFRRYAKKD